jgi:hypothetical protein
MKMKHYEINEETHEYNGQTYKDLVCYFGEKRFILVPLTKSVKCKSLFYALLDNKVKM